MGSIQCVYSVMSVDGRALVVLLVVVLSIHFKNPLF